VAATVVCISAVCLAGCSGSDGASDDSASTTTSEAPTTTVLEGAPAGAEEIGLRELEIGQCFETIDDPRVEDLAVWTVDCAAPHTYEVYDEAEYEGDGVNSSMYPGTAEVQDWSEQACFDRFEAFVGVRWTLSELEIQLWWPSEESWSRDDRTIICTVLASSGDKVSGTQRGVSR